MPTFGRPTMATTGSAAAERASATGGATPRRTRRRCAGVVVDERRAARSSGRPASRRRRGRRRRARRRAAASSGVPAISRIRWATSRRSSIGVEVPPVTPTIARPVEDGRRRSGRDAPSIWIAGVPAISHSRVSSFVFALERPPTTTIRSTSRAASRVSSWRRIVTGQTVLTILSSWLAADHERGELLELPGRLGRLADQGHPLLARDFCSHSSSSSTTIASGAKPSMPTTSGCFGRAEQDDRVALVDELDAARGAPG